MQKKLILFVLLLLWQSAVAVELEPYALSKISLEQWNQFHAKVKKALADSRTTFRYEAGELENYAEPKSYTNITFTTPGHKAHPAWVTTRFVFDGKKIGVHVVGYYGGDEAAYQDFYQRMNAMVRETLKSLGQK
jgi:hypothetical protein